MRRSASGYVGQGLGVVTRARSSSQPRSSGYRGASPTPCSDAQVESKSPSTHKERRAAIEDQRRQFIERSVAKRAGGAFMSRAEEIECLQQKLDSGTCSSAAVTGLRKRLATLRAAELRT